MRTRAVVALVVGLSPPLAMAASAPGTGAEGRVLYGRYCGACHGIDADGRGPVASFMVRAPTDLRRLGDRYGRPLDVDRVARFVDGREEVAAHGPRLMPVWGERFAAPEPEASGRKPSVDPRVRKIVAYLATLQGIPESR